YARLPALAAFHPQFGLAVGPPPASECRVVHEIGVRAREPRGEPRRSTPAVAADCRSNHSASRLLVVAVAALRAPAPVCEPTLQAFVLLRSFLAAPVVAEHAAQSRTGSSSYRARVRKDRRAPAVVVRRRPRRCSDCRRRL